MPYRDESPRKHVFYVIMDENVFKWARIYCVFMTFLPPSVVALT